MELVVLRHQHLMHVIGMAEQDALLHHDAKARDISVGSGAQRRSAASGSGRSSNAYPDQLGAPLGPGGSPLTRYSHGPL